VDGDRGQGQPPSRARVVGHTPTPPRLCFDYDWLLPSETCVRSLVRRPRGRGPGRRFLPPSFAAAWW
jgi:hypothetical protein